MIEKKPFVNYTVGEKEIKDVFTVRLNEDQRKLLNDCKKILEQKKDSTCIKDLAWIGANVIHGKNTAFILSVIFKNKKNNKRNGIIDFE